MRFDMGVILFGRLKHCMMKLAISDCLINQAVR